MFDFNKPEQRAILFLSSGCCQYPGNPQLDSVYVKGAAGNCRRDIVQNRVQNPETCSRVLKGDNQSQNGCEKLQRDTAQGNKPKSSRVCRKLQRKIEIQLQTTRLDHHNLQVTDYGYVERVFTNLRRKLNGTEDDEMFHLKTNVLIWGLFMSTTMKSAIHLGLEYDQNLSAYQNTNFGGIKTLFDISLRLISENAVEIQNLSTMMYDFSLWMRMTLCHDQVIRLATAKVHVYSDSVLCLGRKRHPSKANNNPRSTQNCLELRENQLKFE